MAHGPHAGLLGRRSGGQRRLAAILFADVVGYSRMIAEDEARTLANVRTLRHRLIEPYIAAHAGRPFAALGDGFVAEFSSAVEAVACAAAVQRELAAGGSAVDLGLMLRVGINVGDVVVDATGDVFGDTVNVAARLQVLAEPGGVTISANTFEELRGRLSYPFEDSGEQKLKNIPRPVPMYSLSAAAIRRLPTAELDNSKLVVRPRSRKAIWVVGGVLTAALVAGGVIWWVGISHLSASLAERVTIQDPAQSPRPADLLTAAASTPVIAVLPFAVSAQPPIEPALMDC
jgi:adenylate cyclase